ncbi:trigger factor, partial [Candidatus Liberibacter sp.]|uniref:trigger factor n=1 Tax=Candidatus Liberibacter sp. TaxID=34022 RepID=UPI0015F35428
MQVIETIVEGLKRELEVVVSSAQLMGRINERLEDIKNKARIKGFRLGKVPMSHIKAMYGKSILSEIVDEIIKETTSDILSKRDERTSLQPQIKLNEEKEEITRLLEGSTDLKFTISYEVFPVVEIKSFDDLQIVREVCEIDEQETDKQMLKIAEKNLAFEVKEGISEVGDRITVDYDLSVDGEILKDQCGKNVQFILGTEDIFPGVKDNLLGIKAGDNKTVEVLFPEDHSIKDLAGKTVVF